MGVVIAVANQKGGVGKTTVTANLGASLRLKGQRVLLIDLDPQACLSLSFGIQEPSTSIGDILLDPEREWAPQEVENGLQLIPADDELSRAELLLSQTPAPEQRLSERLSEIREAYDVILCDCPPTIGLLTTNALVAADYLLVPVCSEYLALKGLRKILGLFQGIRARWNPRLSLLGILVAIYDRRSRMSEQILSVLKERFGSQLFETVIRQSAWAKRAPAHERSIVSLVPSSGIAQDYVALADEVTRRVEEAKKSG